MGQSGFRMICSKLQLFSYSNNQNRDPISPNAPNILTCDWQGRIGPTLKYGNDGRSKIDCSTLGLVGLLLHIIAARTQCTYRTGANVSLAPRVSYILVDWQHGSTLN